jgi:hypothetical protein
MIPMWQTMVVGDSLLVGSWFLLGLNEEGCPQLSLEGSPFVLISNLIVPKWI